MKKLSIFILMILVLGITSPASAADFEGWNALDQETIQKEIDQVSDRIGFDPLAGETIYMINSSRHSCWSSFVCFGIYDYTNDPELQGLITHEIGHRILNDLGYFWSDIEFSLGYYENGEYVHVSGIDPVSGKYVRTDLGYIEPNQPYCQHCSYMNPYGQFYREDFADMFMAYFMGYFSSDQAGDLRNSFIEEFINTHILKENK